MPRLRRRYALASNVLENLLAWCRRYDWTSEIGLACLLVLVAAARTKGAFSCSVSSTLIPHWNRLSNSSRERYHIMPIMRAALSPATGPSPLISGEL